MLTKSCYSTGLEIWKGVDYNKSVAEGAGAKIKFA
jgi:hypothetical protein